MKVWQAISPTLVSLLVAGCSEIETVPTRAPYDAAAPRIEAPESAPARALSMGEVPPDDIPEEFIGHATWIDVSADVGWMSPNQAYGQAIVRYWASNATANIDLKVRNAQGVQVGENTARSQDWWLIPWRSTLYASTAVTVSGTCGHIAQATASGTVWDSAISSAQGLLSWGNQSRTVNKSAEQPACEPTMCLEPNATNYGGALPCTFASSGTASGGGDGSTPPYTGGTPTEPPSYQPAPFVPSGHWECTVWYSGTDYEREYCTWYDHNATRLAPSAPALSRIGSTGATSNSRSTGALPSVFVIVSDQLPAGAMGVIERHRDGPYRNVLLLPSSATRPAALVAALRALAESRDRHGETPAKRLQLTLEGTVADQQIPAAVRQHAAGITALLARATHADAGTYGTRQILEVRLADR
jgi:hypothetical protein